MTPATVFIAGLGLIGGSLARDLSRLGHRVLGADRSEESVAAALADGVLAEGFTGPAAGWRRGAGTADVVILAVPVHALASLLEELAPATTAATLVMDTGSAKEHVLAAAEAAGLRDRFVGAHPLAGDHRSGWTAARTGLFRDRRVYLCPAAGVPAARTARAAEFWQAVGAVPLQMDAADHDRQLAWTSHLPQLAATALGVTLARAGIDRKELGTGGQDTTRLAASDPAMWAGVAAHNAANLARTLTALQSVLDEMRAALENGDAQRLIPLLEAARNWRGEPASQTRPHQHSAS